MTMNEKNPGITTAEQALAHMAQCPENHIGIIDASGRPELPNFKERVKGGADAKLILAEALDYHKKAGTLDGQGGFMHSATYRWLKARADAQ